MTTMLDSMKRGFSGNNAELVKLGQLMSGLSEKQKIAQVSSLQLNNTQKALVLQSSGLTAAQTKQALSTTAVAAAKLLTMNLIFIFPLREEFAVTVLVLSR